MHPGTPSSVPVPLLVYAVASRVNTELQPLPDSTVTLHRSSAESEVAKFDEGEVALVERRILPWAPAREENDRLSLYEYTVGYRDGGHHTTPWGLSFSTDRSAIETELAAVQTAIAESNVDGSFDVLMLERPIFPWYFARPRPAKLH